MKDKKLQVFVSSTYTDLIQERQAAVEAILATGNIPAGMELFAAGDESQMVTIERWIDESDVYMLILGGRYGSVDPKTGKSYTQLEYEYAVSTKKPLFAVVINDRTLDEKVKQQGRAVLEQDNPGLLKDFRALVKTNLVKFWSDTKDIKLSVHETLSDFGYRKELVGWIRGNSNVTSPLLAEQIAQLSKENSELREKIDLRSQNQDTHYSGLTYQQMHKALSNYKLNYSKYKNVYEFLIEHGRDFALDGLANENSNNNALDALILYRLVQQRFPGSSLHEFTPDGHNFYLRATVADGLPPPFKTK